MANTLVQFRTDEAIRLKAMEICEKLGLDLSSYLKICITRLVQENGIPFSMKLEEKRNSGIEAMKTASQIAEKLGISEMTLDEINAEIAYTRKQ